MLAPALRLSSGLTPRASLAVSTLPLRVRFSLVVAAIAALVIGAVWWLTLRVGVGQGEATLWFALSAVLLVTLLVDQAAGLLVYRRLVRSAVCTRIPRLAISQSP